MSPGHPTLAALALLLAVPAGVARAAVELHTGPLSIVELEGDVQALQGIGRVPVDDGGGVLEETGAVSDGLLRLVWRATFANTATLELHDRFIFRSRTASDTAAPIGLGVTREPPRLVDLRSELVDGEEYYVSHDVDRLAFRFFAADFELRMGRVAIEWGTTRVFPVLDLWARYSPWELDQTRRRGVDAVQVLTARGAQVDLQAVVAHMGAAGDVSALLRADFYVNPLGITLVAGKVYDELSLGVAADMTLGVFRLYNETLGVYELEHGDLRPPRSTLGFAWRGTRLDLALEGHFNGAGADDEDDYVEHMATSDPFERGEVYLLGRWYAGARAAWRFDRPVTLSLRNLTNVTDASSVFHVDLRWEATLGIEVHAGAWVSVGERPEASDGEVIPRSEMGRLGNLYYLRLLTGW